MKSMIKELLHGNISPQEDSRTNSPEMKELVLDMTKFDISGDTALRWEIEVEE